MSRFLRHAFTVKVYLQKQIFNLASKTKQKNQRWMNINIAKAEKKMNMKNVPKTYNKIDLP